MARLGLLIFLAAALGMAHAAEQQVLPEPTRTVMKAWTWSDCGMFSPSPAELKHSDILIKI